MDIKIARILTAFIPVKTWRRKLRSFLTAEKPNIKTVNKKLDNLSFQLNIMMNHFLDISKASPATGNLRVKQLQRYLATKKAVELLEANNIEYWLDFGTLIGAVRHGEIIPWDNDYDIALMAKDTDKFINIFTNAYRNDSDFSFIDCSEIWKRQYGKNEFFKVMNKEYTDSFCDFFVYDEVPNNKNLIYRRKDFGTENAFVFERNTIFPLQNALFFDREYKIPNKYDEYLTSIYGEWKTFPTSSNYYAEIERMGKRQRINKHYKVYYI